MTKIDRLFWDEELAKETLTDTKTAPTAKGRKTKRWDPFISDCDHWRQPFDLEDGLKVFASAWMDRPMTSQDIDSRPGFDGSPDIGFYLDTRWGDEHLLVSPGVGIPFARKQQQIVLFPWPDYGVPRDSRVLLKALRWLSKQIAAGKTVDVGCMGGHGRTGTVLCALLLVQGLPLDAAFRRVRRRYCVEAIESQRQIELLVSISKSLKRHK